MGVQEGTRFNAWDNLIFFPDLENWIGEVNAGCRWVSIIDFGSSPGKCCNCPGWKGGGQTRRKFFQGARTVMSSEEARRTWGRSQVIMVQTNYTR